MNFVTELNLFAAYCLCSEFILQLIVQGEGQIDGSAGGVDHSAVLVRPRNLDAIDRETETQV
jgi:hypothetical protein